MVKFAALMAFLCSFVTVHGQAEDLTIPGSGNPEFVLRQLANAFGAAQQSHRVFIPVSTGTAGAMRDIAEAKTTMGRVGRPLRKNELDSGLVYVPLGRDAVVFATGVGAGVSSITRAQAVDIYTGKIDNWRMLGAAAASIRAIAREETDASRQIINREIKPFADIRFHKDVKIVNLDPQMVALLERYPASLGFMNRSGLYSANVRVVPLSLEAIAPTLENIENGSYPLVMEFGLIYKAGALTRAGAEFLAYIGTPDGVRILRQYSVLPMRNIRQP